MKRIPGSLDDRCFDIAIIGGGITGACLATDAARRGLSVALVEKSDFGGATSSASSKLLHGGIRYLQQLQFAKVRESAYERAYFQNLAPHLTRYIPFVIPSYRGLSKGRPALGAALSAYRMLCAGQNARIRDPGKRVPEGHLIGRDRITQLLSDFRVGGLTGGLVIHESHMHSSERMTLAFLDTAYRLGAVVVNYMEAESLLGIETGRVAGVRVKDRLTGDIRDVRAGLVINAAGPWIPKINKAIESSSTPGVVTAYSKGAHILTRSLTQGYALALPIKKQNQSLVNRGGRHVFIIPWRGRSLIGTTYRPYDGDLDEVRPTEDDIREMLDDINSALGGRVLARDDILHAYAGLYPLTDEVVRPGVYQGTGRYEIVDHAVSGDMTGLLSVFGAKYTTARLLAEKALDYIVNRYDMTAAECTTRYLPLHGGEIDDMEGFRRACKDRYGALLDEECIEHLVTNYGTRIDALISYIESDSSLGQELLPGSHVLAAEAVHAAREEMVCHLDDFVFRRSGLGTLGNPGISVLQRCAGLIGAELGWSESVMADEITRTLKGFITC